MSVISTDFSPITVEEFFKYFPAFKHITDPAVQFQLDLSMEVENKAAWGRYWRFAVMLATAHELALLYNVDEGVAEERMNSPTNIGFTTSEAASPGSLSRGSAMPAWMTGDDVLDSYYGRTIYGQRYLVLLIRVIPPGIVVYSPQVTRRDLSKHDGYWSVTAP